MFKDGHENYRNCGSLCARRRHKEIFGEMPRAAFCRRRPLRMGFQYRNPTCHGEKDCAVVFSLPKQLVGYHNVTNEDFGAAFFYACFGNCHCAVQLISRNINRF
jgi:hypothetical protein